MIDISSDNTTTTADDRELPLVGLRVLDLSDGKGEMCGRILADLGADVLLVEPPQGASSRRRQPIIDGHSLYFASHNANKRSIALDLHSGDGRNRFLTLLDSADILIETMRPGELENLGLAAAELHRRNPRLVIISISDFGQGGPYSDFAGSEAAQLAMAGMLCRSGQPGMDPLLPPGHLSAEASAIQAAWCVLLSYWQRLQIDVGDYLDFSVFEGTAQILDPILGVTGSAAAGRSATQMAQVRGRPDAGHLYPIFRCKDGYVRMCILNPRQWQGMSQWLGDDHPYTDPQFANMAQRFQVIHEINKLIGDLTRGLSIEEAEREGQRRGVPVAALSTLGEAMHNTHFRARGSFAEFEASPNRNGLVPSGYLEIDGRRAGIRRRAPRPGEHNDQVFSEPARDADGDKVFTSGSQHRPLSGLRVLDLGVIVAGAELGRVLADQGAELIKVENRAFPDGSRQHDRKGKVSFSFTQGHRGQQSLGLNLRTPRGIELFKKLAERSDIILSNFKPGTMESLGIGYDAIKEVNPRIIMADSSALGNSGPLSRSMGYGPLVRATSGLTGLWRYPDVEGSFSDGVTIIPDHLAARVSAIGILALLIRRQRTGKGGTVSVAQAECILGALSTEFLRESLAPGTIRPLGNHGEFEAPDGIFPCAGDDEWCAVSVRGDQDWVKLCNAIDRPDLLNDERLSSTEGRVLHRDEVIAAVSAWTILHPPEEVMQGLQAAGVPAGKMFRLSELDHNEHLQARHFYRSIRQPGYDEAWPTENAPVISLNMPDPDIRPAPFQGQHTREIAARVLGLDAAEIKSLIDVGVLEPAE